MYTIMFAENDVQIETQKDNPLATILTEIRQSEVRMDTRLRKLKADIQRSQDQAVERATKRARREKTYNLKSRDIISSTSSMRASLVASNQRLRR